jgi:hypothetical protein
MTSMTSIKGGKATGCGIWIPHCRGTIPLYREGGGIRVIDVTHPLLLNEVKYLGRAVRPTFALSLGRHSARSVGFSSPCPSRPHLKRRAQEAQGGFSHPPRTPYHLYPGAASAGSPEEYNM